MLLKFQKFLHVHQILFLRWLQLKIKLSCIDLVEIIIHCMLIQICHHLVDLMFQFFMDFAPMEFQLEQFMKISTKKTLNNCNNWQLVSQVMCSQVKPLLSRCGKTRIKLQLPLKQKNVEKLFWWANALLNNKPKCDLKHFQISKDI